MREFFAFFPVTCGNETRWLEHVKIRQWAVEDWLSGGIERWMNVGFVDNDITHMVAKQVKSIMISVSEHLGLGDR